MAFTPLVCHRHQYRYARRPGQATFTPPGPPSARRRWCRRAASRSAYAADPRVPVQRTTLLATIVIVVAGRSMPLDLFTRMPASAPRRLPFAPATRAPPTTQGSWVRIRVVALGSANLILGGFNTPAGYPREGGDPVRRARSSVGGRTWLQHLEGGSRPPSGRGRRVYLRRMCRRVGALRAVTCGHALYMRPGMPG